MYVPGPRPTAEPHAHRHPRSLAAVAATALVPVALLVAAHHPALSLGVVLGAAARRVADAASRRLRPLVARRSGPPSA